MCRSIRTLYHLDPPTTRDEVQAAARQFVRKVSGFREPSLANAEPFEQAIEEITRATERLLGTMVTKSPPKDREVLAARARERAERRYGDRSAPKSS